MPQPFMEFSRQHKSLVVNYGVSQRVWDAANGIMKQQRGEMQIRVAAERQDRSGVNGK